MQTESALTFIHPFYLFFTSCMFSFHFRSNISVLLSFFIIVLLCLLSGETVHIRFTTSVCVCVCVSVLVCSVLYYRPEHRISGFCYAYKIGQCFFVFCFVALTCMEYTLYERISGLRSVSGIPGNNDKKPSLIHFTACVIQIHNRHNLHNHIHHHTSNPTSNHPSNSI